MDLILGIDTSNYTTSLCAISYDNGRMVSEARQLLPVTEGERGLRQSDALFFHVQQLPAVMSRLMTEVKARRVKWHGVGVSVRPRPFATSYMPVFRAGTSFAEASASMLGVPLVRTSHQEGHLAAADRELPIQRGEPFLAVHLSGGTSDVVHAVRNRNGYIIRQLGTSSDLHAGQFVDRVGVALGLPFPAGPHLEALTKETENEHETPVEWEKWSDFHLNSSVHEGDMSFSGPCSAALRSIEQGIPAAVLGRAVFQCIANSVVKAVTFGYLQTRVNHVVLAGGVISNRAVRSRVEHRLHVLHPTLQVHFAPIPYSSDNALGVATIAYRFLTED